MTDDPITGGCACGQVRFRIRGTLIRAGLCHCLDCRKSHGAAFNPFLVFARDAVDMEGETVSWTASTGYTRFFCPTCGSPVKGEDRSGAEVELSLGNLDEPSLFAPEYEIWTVRREAWLSPLPVPQHLHNGPG